MLTSSKDFEAGAHWPLSWKVTARNLKHAADHLYFILDIAYQRRLARIMKEAKLRQRGQHVSRSKILVGHELEDLNDTQLESVYLFLVALALENLFKGIAIARHPDLVTPEQSRRKKITTHDLDTLSRLANVLTTAEETAWLKSLSQYIEWKGRYMIPLNRQRLEQSPLTDSELGYLNSLKREQKK